MTLPTFRRLLPMLCISAVCSPGGCQNQPKPPPPPLATPAMVTSAQQYTGTPLSGPRLAVADVGPPADALDVSVRWVAVESAPPGVQETLASQCRLIIDGQSGAPMLVSPDLTRRVLFDQSGNVAALEAQYVGPATLSSAPVGLFEAALPPDVTAAFAASTAVLSPPRSHVVIRIGRPSVPTTVAATQSSGQSLEMTLEIGQDDSTTTQPTIPKIETAVFDRALVNGHDKIAIVIPVHFNDSPARALLALIEIKPTVSAALLTRCHVALEESAAAEAKQPFVYAVEGSAWAGYDSALRALWQPQTRRSALVFLAAQTEAHICEDTALVADDALLEKLANTVALQAASTSVPHTTAALSWLLDHASFKLLVLSDAPGGGGAATAPTPLPPELKAVLTLYAGEPARHGGSLDDIAQQSTSRQDLENRLTAENLVFLTDASPASRVRAFDWLKARNLAPAGFDPLGPGKQRREALDKALSANSD